MTHLALSLTRWLHVRASGVARVLLSALTSMPVICVMSPLAIAKRCFTLAVGCSEPLTAVLSLSSFASPSFSQSTSLVSHLRATCAIALP